MIDKFKTCKDCPDRTIQPNCHTTCEGYLARCKKNEEIRKAKAEDYDMRQFDGARTNNLRKLKHKKATGKNYKRNVFDRRK